MLAILAAAPPAADPVSTWVGMLGTLGFAVWYGYYVTAITIPKINVENNKLVEKIVNDFREEMKLERDSHAADMKSQREDCQREMAHIVSYLNSRPKARGD